MRGTTERRDCRQAAVSAAGTAVWLLAAAAVLLWVRQAFFPSGAASVLLAVLAAVQAAGLIPLGLALRDRLNTEMLVEARQIATKRMVDAAEALGADAVVGLRYASASVMQGAAEVIAYGTAVKFK